MNEPLLFLLIQSRFTVSSSYDQLVRSLLVLSGLQTESRLAPRSARTRTADRCLSFTASMRMIVRVHNGTADCRTDAHVTFAAGLADVDQVVIAVSDDADRCAAQARYHSHFA